MSTKDKIIKFTIFILVAVLSFIPVNILLIATLIQSSVKDILDYQTIIATIISLYVGFIAATSYKKNNKN